MNIFVRALICAGILGLSACNDPDNHEDHAGGAHDDHAAETVGQHGGRLLQENGFSLEITIFESGVPPEFRVWAMADGLPVDPADVDLSITLKRLGGITDQINFAPEGGYLRGDTEVYEPHSFEVEVAARYKGARHQWRYDNLEGRTIISSDLAQAAGIETESAGPAVIRNYATVYGQVVSNPESVGHVMARFDGVIQSVKASIGDEVTRGQILAAVEANDSLINYNITAPVTGTIVERHANSGESTAGRTLFTIINTRTVWAELAVFPSDRARIRIGAPVKIRTAIGEIEAAGTIDLFDPVAGHNQSVTARVKLENPDGLLAAGMYLTGEIEVAQTEVPLAVRRSGLQPFRDFTVVFAQFDDTYEVRMLELGRQDNEWAEVLGGLRPRTRYVSTNSYVIKADIEKSGAAHDH
ncbi:MAG: efflux RND transporter periplasmic adaptor subunit [Pseudomonadales bacterium]|nr:efflux RND transporter periplasmic adaptor subunit [Pseudomonadales bacterium]